MADFRRWILALAVVALLAGFTVPAGAQPVVCNTSVTVTPIVRAEGLSELVGDLVLYCTGGSPTAPGRPVPQVNVTVFLNTNITSKVLGTQLASFGNGQTSGLDEALLIIDEPNSPNSDGVQCGPKGAWNGSNFAQNVCLGTITSGLAGTVTSYSVSGLPYPILNCGAVVGGVAAAPDGGPNGPGVCEIIAPSGPGGAPAPEHTYDGTIATQSYVGGNSPYTDPCGTGVTLVYGTTTNGSATVTALNPGTAGIQVGNFVVGPGFPGTLLAPVAKIVALGANSFTASSANTLAGVTVNVPFAIFGAVNLTSTTQNADVTNNNTLITNLSAGSGGLFVGQIVSGLYFGLANITAINSATSITISSVPTGITTPTGTINEPVTFYAFNGQQAGAPGSPGYSCGRPNVFQGRLGALQNANQYNAVTFLGVPLDPPGTAIGRTIRITNIRANAAQLGVSSTFTTQQILMNVAINGPTTITIANPQQIVAYVNKGLSSVAIAPAFNTSFGSALQASVPSGLLGGGSLRTGIAPNVPGILEFVQCVSQNPDLFLGTPAPSFLVPGYLGTNPTTNANSGFSGGYNCPGGGDCTPPAPDVTPWVRFSEGFASSWKEKNIAFTVGDGTGTTAGRGNANYNTTTLGFNCAFAYCYNGNQNYPLDVPQNVPGAVYNTETGFSYPAITSGLFGAPPNPNPPVGFQFNADIIGGTVPNQGNPFSDDWAGSANATGISGAGIANQGTRLYLSFGNIPAGASLWLAPVIYLFRQGVQHNGDPATLNPNPITAVAQSQATGVMVMTTTDGAGAGAFLRTQAINRYTLTKVGASNLVVYEMLYTDPYSVEYADVPVVLAYASNPGQNLPAPAPPNPNTTVTGGFAPFYTSAASTQPSPNNTFQSPTLPVPRFVPGTAFDFINIQKCSCNVLFPFVANALGYDTGIAFANTSLDPGGTYGFSAVPQPGTVTFWYYGDMTGGAATPGPQTSSVVQPGHVLTYVLSTGSTQYGLDGRGAGLTGYIIAQSQFQYCHAYAFISAQGAGPTSPGTSEGYLGIVLDQDGLRRTFSIGENKAH